MSRTARIFVAAIVAIMSASALWRLQNPPIEPKQTTWTRGGFAQMELGLFGPARMKFLKILTQDPDNRVATEHVSFIELLGSPFSELTDQEALVEYDSLVRLHPESLHLKLIGSILYRRNNTPERSIQILRDVAEENSEIPHLWFEIAMAKRSLGDHAGAIDALHKALELGQQDLYFKQLGNEYFYTGDWPRAKQNYQNALDLNSKLIEPKIGFLRCLVLMNRPDEAIDYGQQLLAEMNSKSTRIERWLHRSLIGLIRGTKNYSVERDLTFDELLQFIEAEIELARSTTNFQASGAEQWEARLGPKVYSIIEFELKHLGL